MEEDQKFTLYWRDGQRNVVRGRTISEAMNLAGYGGGTLGALDFYAKGEDSDYRWNAPTREWVATSH